jgi:hypothetical protein
MGLLDEIRAHDTTGNRPRCRVEVVLAEVTGDDLADLRTALADYTVPGTAIANAMKSRGYDLPAGSIARHRRGACACPR